MNLPQPLYTAEQVRNGEKLAADALGVAMYQLMLSAGQAVFDVLTSHYPTSTRMLVICGGGNNGGDGYVVARLAIAAGYSVKVWSLNPVEELKGDALSAYQAFIAAGGEVSEQDDSLLDQFDLVVDALLGTGFKGELREPFQRLINAVNSANLKVISVDIPSGLEADTGKVSSVAIRAEHTVTFIGVKQGLMTGQARDFVGQLIVAGLGVEDTFSPLVESHTQMIEPVRKMTRSGSAHKGSHGRVTLIGGGKGLGGAILLASKACLRTGAGLTACLTHKSNVTAGLIHSPEVMFSAWSKQEANQRLTWSDVIALGPGLGFSDSARWLYQQVSQMSNPKVLDADALTMLAQAPTKDDNRIITPHPGEAARLLNCTTGQVEDDRYHAVAALQQRYGGVVVLKGAGTLVCDGVKTYVCGAGNPGMAVGGMGDVLTGVVAALLAQGFGLRQAACYGVMIHSLAADLNASQYGMIGMSATDVTSSIRAVVNSAD
ncbi:NAD(P)H-hydrate dehydratase [Vibrio intestinalis]|uniref:NAD(P)H-hydrate dehydratase n=1 Tax=Vibrio intestinalis TaxID=2933291 RepID=UPI0021A5277F|nr:NAD(P)H-hydrate dehydratase [Vibrio intestinalis]